MPWTVANRHLPRDASLVQVVGGEAAVRRLVERNAVERGQGARRAASIAHVAAARVARVQADNGRRGDRRDIEKFGGRINRGTAPVGTAHIARHLDVAALGRRREQRTAVPLRQRLERERSQLRRERHDVIVRKALPVEWWWLRRERLALRRLLAGHGRLRYGPLVNGPQRLAGLPIEDVDESLLADLRHRLDAPAVTHHIDQVRRGGKVVVPESVVHGLEVPDPLPGSGVQAHEAFGEQVVAGTMAAVEVVGRRAERQVDVARLLVNRHERPDVRVAGVLGRALLP